MDGLDTEFLNHLGWCRKLQNPAFWDTGFCGNALRPENPMTYSDNLRMLTCFGDGMATVQCSQNQRPFSHYRQMGHVSTRPSYLRFDKCFKDPESAETFFCVCLPSLIETSAHKLLPTTASRIILQSENLCQYVRDSCCVCHFSTSAS